MNALSIFEPRKKTGQSVTPIWSIKHKGDSGLSQYVEDTPSPKADPPFPSLGHDFSRIPVHAMSVQNSPTVESCPLRSSPRRCPFGGACHACPPRLQAKLAISQPGDQYEQEADRVVEQMMQGEEPSLHQGKSLNSTPQNAAIKRKCTDCGDDKEPLQKKESCGQGVSISGCSSDVPPIVDEVLRSPGQPLDAEMRAFFEPRFGHDFGKIRVHTDSTAAESARALNALAYTVARHIIFGTGQYSPRTNAGQQLMAHELVHSVQQADLSSKPLQDSVLIQRMTDVNFGILPEGWEGGFYGPRKLYTGKYVCGPDVTTPVRNVLDQMETYFTGLTHGKKVDHCEALHSLKPLVSLAAWDINPLYCENARWLDDLTLKGICDIPGDGQTDDNEPSSTCKHSVRDHGKCVLAGTLNYFTWGQMHRLCHNYALSATNKAAANPLNPVDWDKTNMNRYIIAYKVLSVLALRMESPTVPIAFAEAAFASGSGAVPPIENRAQCKDACTAKTSPPGGWTWTWYPDHL